jgi:2-(1,2-epoxy-1,2-dihydrophenyl)acetyl-CoA isomerase
LSLSTKLTKLKRSATAQTSNTQNGVLPTTMPAHAQHRRRLAATAAHLATATKPAAAAASVVHEEELPEVIFQVRDDNVAVIRLNNPASLNPMGADMLQGFHAALKKVEDPESGIRCLLITGEGRAFCSGANLTGGGGGGGGPPQAFSMHAGLGAAHSLEAQYNPMIARLRDLRCPVVAAVNGPCAGVGMSFAMVADLVIANESAFFLQAFRNIGLVPDGGATFMLPRLVGWGRAMELAMMGERCPAAKALEWGLVNEVHPDDAMLDVALEKAASLAAGPTATLTMIRQMYWASTTNSLEEQLALEVKNQNVASGSADALEGRLAFVEKRQAEFKGH